MTLLDLFKNSSSFWSTLSGFMIVLFWVVGIWIAFAAVLDFKELSDGKSGFSKPIFKTILASLMIAITRFIPTLSNTFNGTDQAFNPQKLLTDIPASAYNGAGAAFSSVLLFIQCLGAVSIFRGFMMLTSQANGQKGNIGKGLTHIIGGVLAVNIELTIKMFAATFYPNLPLPF